ncbi:DUF2267 family protein [Ensifer sp. WSM1721]|uniref:DUF2267 domain-containing protein n=1 Tax=Ensifer sp. WSM1721 TaxID=1041159 RepID=UPI00047AEF08|nr:DUF2267 domain-containing protein [Ensifer sp. WSM1721]
MSATGLDVFDKTLQTTNIWLGEIMEHHGPDRKVAWHILNVVLRALRDRLPPEVAAHLGAELPLLVRGAYYDQYRPNHQPDKATRSLDEFLATIADGLKNTRPVNPTEAAKAVFRVLARHVDLGQTKKVRDTLPKEIRALWPDSVGAGG